MLQSNMAMTETVPGAGTVIGTTVRLFVALCALAAAAVPLQASAHDAALIEKKARGTFEETSTGIREALKENKMAIVRQIHFHDMLSMVGIESENILTFETFHPRFGKVLYANDRAAFIEAPLRIHLRQTDDGVVVRYRLPSSVFSPYRGLSDMGAKLDAIFADVVGRVAD